MLHIAMIALAVLSRPTPTTPAHRLAAHIVETSPSAAPYAQELAERILWESQHYGLDPALFAAIGYLESRYRMYPHGGRPETHLASLWQVYPSTAWLTIPRAERMRLSRSVVVSTGRAALILARHVRGRSGAAVYARYNRTPPRRSYIVALYRRARVIRAVLNPSQK